MEQIKGFVLSLMAATAVSAVVELFLPDGGGMKKYMRYFMSLAILLTLLSPLKSLVSAIPDLADIDIDAFAELYDDTEAMARANSIVAMHIKNAVCQRFGLETGNVSIVLNETGVSMRVKKKLGLFESDLSEYVKNQFGVLAEVVLYE